MLPHCCNMRGLPMGGLLHPDILGLRADVFAPPSPVFDVQIDPPPAHPDASHTGHADAKKEKENNKKIPWINFARFYSSCSLH